MDFKKHLPHLLAIAAMFAVCFAFFAPNVFNNKALPQPDNDKARGMQTEIQKFMKETGEAPMWTNSAFGGMPSFQIYAPVHGNLTAPIAKALFLWRGVTSVWVLSFVAMFCMYLFLMALRLDWRASLFGALAFGINTYNCDIIEAGHSTKMATLALSPGILAGVIYLFRGKYWLGGGLVALFTAMNINANHVQITFYIYWMIAFYVIYELIFALKHSGAALAWAKKVGVLIVAALLGVASNTSRLWPTYEYSQESNRGGSELTEKKAQGGGLSKDYLFGWSYGVGESLTLLVPHAYGGGANEAIDNTEFFDLVARGGSPEQRHQMARQTASIYYTGEQTFVGTAIYFGAVVIFMFLIGAFLAKGSEKWWFLTAAIFALTLAWGKHFFLNHLFFDYLPMFNKFRAVSMALGPSLLFVSALAALGLQKLFDEDITKATKKRAAFIALGISVFFCLVAMLFAGGDGANDAQVAEQIKMPLAKLSDILSADRSGLARSDAFRSIFFILAAFGLVWFGIKGTLKAAIAVPMIALLALIDNWGICARTLNASDYVDKTEATAPPKPDAKDLQILADKDPYFRVLDLSRGGITGNATSSYFYKSLSGYHAAKLQRYQEVVDRYFGENLGKNLHIVGMLNGKYLISQKGDVMPNQLACGHAWFVKDFKVVNTGDEELNALATLNPKDTAVVQASFAKALEGLKIISDSSAKIDITKYNPAKLEFEYSCATEQLAVFPEVYYPAERGWKSYLNGQPAADIIKVDYLLRGMRLPAGQNQKLEMRFEPKSYYVGEKISLFASILTLLLFSAGLFFLFKRGGGFGNAANLVDNASDKVADKFERSTVASVKPVQSKRKK